MRRFADTYTGDYRVLEESESKVILESPYPVDYPEVSRIHLYLYPSSGGKGAVLFVHGLGRYNLRFLRWFPERFSRLGFTSALVVLPYHFDRTPRGFKSGELFLNTTDNDVLRSRFEHAVVDLLASFDFMRDRYGERIYVMGYSFGGMISTMASAFRNPKALSLIVSGGNFLHITWESVVTKVFRVQYESNKECDVKKCRFWHSRENFWKFIEDLEDPRIPLNSAPMKCYEYDPLVFAKFVKSPVIFFKAVFDFFIPSKSSDELFENLGSIHKEKHLLLSGHIGSFLVWRRYIVKKSAEFFERVRE